MKVDCPSETSPLILPNSQTLADDRGKTQTKLSGGKGSHRVNNPQTSPNRLSQVEMSICLPCVTTSINAFSTSQRRQRAQKLLKKGCLRFQPCRDGGQVRAMNSCWKHTAPLSGTVTQISLPGTLSWPAPPALVSPR